MGTFGYQFATKRIKSIVKSQISLYPLIQIQDLYKLAFQAAMGSEHAIKDQSAAHEWLFQELAEVVSNPSLPLVEEISPSGEIVRINLEPFVAHDGNPDLLLQAFVKTANTYHGSIEKLQDYLNGIENLAKNGEINFHGTDLKEIFLKMRSSGFPPVHHSSHYEKSYHPHYRVIARDYSPLLNLGLS